MTEQNISAEDQKRIAHFVRGTMRAANYAQASEYFNRTCKVLSVTPGLINAYCEQLDIALDAARAARNAK